jgi:hypothetical protein
MKDNTEKSCKCSICGIAIDSWYISYPNPVCKKCDSQALNKGGLPPKSGMGMDDYKKLCKETGKLWMPPDDGDNPVFVNGKKCWRRYKFGGWVTMLDKYDCKDISEFYDKIEILHKDNKERNK